MIDAYNLGMAAVVMATKSTDSPTIAALVADSHYRDMYERLAVQLLSDPDRQDKIASLGLTEDEVVSQTATFVLWKAAEANLAVEKRRQGRK